MFEIPWYRHGVTYLVTDSRLSEEDRESLEIEATLMYLDGVEEKVVSGDGFKGVLSNTRKYQVLGTFGGIQFDAELYTIYGKSNLSFIVSEQTFGPGPSSN
jgi:hypothetical protein